MSMDLVIWGRSEVGAQALVAGVAIVVGLVVRVVKDVGIDESEEGDCDVELKSEPDSLMCSEITSGARNEGVPARRVRPDSSKRIGSWGFSFMSLPPAAASRWAYEK
jgi:hypothetical protein